MITKYMYRFIPYNNWYGYWEIDKEIIKEYYSLEKADKEAKIYSKKGYKCIFRDWKENE